MQRRNFLAAAGALGLAGAQLAPQGAQAAAAELKIKKALVFGMLKGDAPLLDRFKMARAAGFEGVEAYTTPDPAGVAELKRASQESGLVIHSIMNQEHWRSPLSDPDPAVVEKSLEGLRASIRNAKELGAETVLLVPGVVQPHSRYEECFDRSRKAIKTVLPMAEDSGIVIAIEEVWNKWLLSPIEFRDFVDSFQSPYVAAYFDVGNVAEYGYPQHWIQTLGKRIKKLHVKGYHTGKRAWTSLLAGTIDWTAVRAALLEIGYEGYMTAELQAGDAEYLKGVSADMDKIIAGTAEAQA